MLSEKDLPHIGGECEAMHFGAISLIPEPCGSTYEALLVREHEKRVISLDPNIRPGFIQDKQKHMDRINRMAAMSDIVKFSDEDLAWFGLKGDEDTLARHWLHHGAKLVVVTRGAEGAVGYTKQLRVEVPSERVEVVDTVGAGDTFDAGILASLPEAPGSPHQTPGRLAHRRPDRQGPGLGAKAAAVTVSRAGANPPWANEIGL